MNILRRFTVFALACMLVSISYGQSKKATVDKILSVVGDRIILYSDIKNSILDATRQGATVPADAECMLLEQAIISKVMMLQAEKDSLPVSEDDIESQLDNRVRSYIQMYGTQKQLEEIAGKTVYQIKDDARASIREQMLGEAMQSKIVNGVRITPSEVKAFFDKIPADSLPFFESELEIGQIVYFPKASRDIDNYIVGEMNNYKKKKKKGLTTFEQLEKSYSEDEATKKNGGKLQMNRNEKTWDPVFLSTAFRLKEGEISDPVKSKFGYHIIKVFSRNGDDVVVGHILRIPPITEDEIKEGYSRLDTVRSKIVSGDMNFNTAAAKYSDEETTKFNGAFILNQDRSPYVTIDALDKELIPIISKLKVGEISQPAAFSNERDKKGVRIVYLKSRSEPHRMNMRDDYSKIANAALGQKKSEALDKWLKSKMPEYYVMIDDNLSEHCPRVKNLLPAKKAF